MSPDRTTCWTPGSYHRIALPAKPSIYYLISKAFSITATTLQCLELLHLPNRRTIEHRLHRTLIASNINHIEHRLHWTSIESNIDRTEPNRTNQTSFKYQTNRTSNIENRTSKTEHRKLNIKNRTSKIEHQKSNIENRISKIEY